MVVSKSEAEMVSWPPSKEKRKLSKIGSGLFEPNTPLIDCRCFKRAELETISFIIFVAVLYDLNEKNDSGKYKFKGLADVMVYLKEIKSYPLEGLCSTASSEAFLFNIITSFVKSNSLWR